MISSSEQNPFESPREEQKSAQKFDYSQPALMPGLITTVSVIHLLFASWQVMVGSILVWFLATVGGSPSVASYMSKAIGLGVGLGLIVSAVVAVIAAIQLFRRRSSGWALSLLLALFVGAAALMGMCLATPLTVVYLPYAIFVGAVMWGSAEEFL